MAIRLSLLLMVCGVGAALADAPKISLRPLPRPALQQPALLQSAVAPPQGALDAGRATATRPLPRPARARTAVTTPVLAQPAAAPSVVAAPLPTLARSAPPQRPPSAAIPPTPVAEPTATPPTQPARKGLLALIAPRAKPPAKAIISRQGSVCGMPAIKGKTLPRVTSKTNGCGIAEPVGITSLDGVKLNGGATIDCPTAIALANWLDDGLRPAFPKSDVVSLTVVDSYSCRPRNNVRGAKISEHGKGHAVDISAVTFANGQTLTVSRNFKALHGAYKAGCGIFGTTLGPGSDGYHEDHMHFDTAPRRNGGAYCR